MGRHQMKSECSIVVQRQKEEIKYYKTLIRASLSYLCDTDLTEIERIEKAKNILNKFYKGY